MPYSLRQTPGTPGTAVLAVPTGRMGRLGTLQILATIEIRTRFSQPHCLNLQMARYGVEDGNRCNERTLGKPHEEGRQYRELVPLFIIK